jgi:hypothetical protein
VVFAQYSCIEGILTMKARGSDSRVTGVAGDAVMTGRAVTVVGTGNERPSGTSGGRR